MRDASRRDFLTLLAGLPFLIALPSGRIVAASLRVRQLRHWTAPDHTRIVLDLDAPQRFETRMFAEGEPRIVVEIPGAELPEGLEELSVPVEDGLVQRVHARKLGGSLLIRVELVRVAEFSAFPLPPNAGGNAHRIVIDVRKSWTQDEQRAQERELEAVRQSGDVVVAIDPGHGGNDPGCLGNQVVEKDVALQVSRHLAGILAAKRGIRPVLTREKDYFVPLPRRQQIARKFGANVFVSIHANSANSTAARGTEIYFVSLQGAQDKAARELVDRENAADLVGGVAPDRVQTPVLDILVHLKQTTTIRRSERLGELMLQRMEQLAGSESRGLKQGPLAVLKSIDAASVLVELGFVTNRKDAALLRDPNFLRLCATQIAVGIDDYLKS